MTEEFSMRVLRRDVPDEEALARLVRDEAERLGMDPESVTYYTRDAYRPDSGTHIGYAFDVFVSADPRRIEPDMLAETLFDAAFPGEREGDPYWFQSYEQDWGEQARRFLASDWLAAREAAAEARGAQAVLDDLERRIRHQAKAAAVGSMEWRAHFADLAHLEAARAAAAGGAR